MSYPVDLDEMEESKLEGELKRRKDLREKGLCDYCERDPEESPCKFPERHSQPVSMNLIDRELEAHPDRDKEEDFLYRVYRARGHKKCDKIAHIWDTMPNGWIRTCLACGSQWRDQR